MMAETKTNVSRESILFGIIGLLLGVVITLMLARNIVNNNMTGMMRINQNQGMMEESSAMMMDHDESMSMEGMSEALKDKVGDEFDKTFIDLMIEHHQGAIDMANLAKVNAKHQEIKDLADDIISAQTKEIDMMRDWQILWSY